MKFGVKGVAGAGARAADWPRNILAGRQNKAAPANRLCRGRGTGDLFALGHGTIKIEVFESIYSKDKNLQIKALEPYYNEKISKLLQKISSVDECQIEFERLTLEIMSEHKNDPFNIGPMIYYYLLKEAEAQNIRILYSLKKVDIKNLI